MEFNQLKNTIEDSISKIEYLSGSVAYSSENSSQFLT